MEYPIISEYIEAIEMAEDNLEVLNYLRPVLDERGHIVMSGGNFAVVFKMMDIRNGSLYAIKCFLKDQEGRAEAYHKICDTLRYSDAPYFTKFEYYDDELFVSSSQTDDETFPVVLMDWVDGIPLDTYVRNHIDGEYELQLLAYRFGKMASWLMMQPFAHGDLKPDNILVTSDGELKLVDYDGMYVPTMKGELARELGSPDFRHPSRTIDDFDEHIDDFALVVIELSLKAISVNPSLLDKFGASDRLLFSEQDYRNISKCNVLKELAPSNDFDLNRLVGLFYIVHSQKQLNIVDSQKMILDNLKDDMIYNVYESELQEIDTILESSSVEYNFRITFKNGCPLYFRINKEKIDEACLTFPIYRNYYIGGGEYSIPRYGNYKEPFGKVRIPAFIKYKNIEYKVTSIDEFACECCYELKEIIIPNTIESIGHFAFNHCKSLESVTLPKHMVQFDISCFQQTPFILNNKEYVRDDESYVLRGSNLYHFELPF